MNLFAASSAAAPSVALGGTTLKVTLQPLNLRDRISERGSGPVKGTRESDLHCGAAGVSASLLLVVSVKSFSDT